MYLVQKSRSKSNLLELSLLVVVYVVGMFVSKYLSVVGAFSFYTFSMRALVTLQLFFVGV